MDGTEIQSEEAGRLDAAQLVRGLRGLSRSLQRFLTAQAQANGLALTELTTLIRAADDGGVIPAEAARELGLQRGSMTSLADRLEQRRLIRRVAHPTDRRLLLLQTTAEGNKLLEGALAPLLSQLSELADALGQDQLEAFNEFVGQLTALLDQHASAPRAQRRSIASATKPRRPRSYTSK
ncbi:MAG: MarR family winged helix-turn-helix transcriptional regulator [Pseudonocardiaceae bacterium]